MSRARDLSTGKFSGTLEAPDLSDGTLTVGTEYVTNGSAKAWVNFNGTGTIAARDSFNLSSLTDNGTGAYTVNFTNAFGAADYAASSIAQRTGSGTGSTMGGVEIPGSGSVPTASTFGVWSKAATSTIEDMPIVTAIVHGDLA